ncbi:MAG: long-chain-fatty-acid--CoA ligase [Pseudonocardiaceae bacterium]|nr:long-chain-fatty-acid--CoA ligase [Pseudonocardiaceae bacterium]
MSGPLLLTHFLDRARDLHPRRRIVGYHHGEEVLRYDYGRYYDRVTRLAGALRRLGVRPGDRVATLAWNHHRHLELYFAVPLVGATLHTVNLRLEPEEIRYILGHAEDRVLVVDSALLPLVEAARSAQPDLRVVTTDGGPGGDLDYEQLVTEGPVLDDPPPVGEQDLAALCYTSGTTGLPKGVGYSHRALYLHTFAACLADGHAISARDTVLHVVPMFHANAWGVPFAATMAGAAQVLPGEHPNVADIARIIEREQVTYVGMVPTLAVDLLRHVGEHGGDLRSLRALVLGGSTPSVDLIRAVERDLGVPAFQGWGMTEISPMGTFSRSPEPVDDDPEAGYRRTHKQGRLLPGLQWRLVDDEGHDMPWDGTAQGELLMRGPWVASSYYRDEHPESFTDGWLRTGDIATIDPDGYLEVVDRKKDLIKSGGEWISSVTLEQALLGHPDVFEAAVVAMPHDRWQERPLAVVVPRAGAVADVAALRAYLAGQLPKWWLPDRIVLVDQIPRTSVGKIDKRRVREAHSPGGAAAGA